MKKNKNVLITGSSQGIGYSIAKVLSEKNYNVIITGRNNKKLEKISNTIPVCGFYNIDLCTQEAPKKLYDFCQNKLGNIDILINNAGEYVYAPIEKNNQKEIDNLFTLNMKVPFLLSQLVIPGMKKNNWGRIINIGSISGVVGEGNASLYSMTKASLIGFSKALALELAQEKITVNTINPGWVDTNLTDNDSLKEDFSQEEIIEMIPQRRFVHPEEVAKLCEYIVSENAKGITGQSINLCAGLSLG